MATTGIFNGSILVLKYNNGIIGHTTSCSLSLSADTPEATSKDSSGFAEYIPGVMSGEISFEGLIKYDDSTSIITLTDAYLARNTVQQYLEQLFQVTLYIQLVASLVL